MPVDIEGLKRLDARATPTPWAWWTSNSVKRITGPDGKDGGVLCSYRFDSGTDVAITDDNMAVLVAARNALPSLIAEVESLRKQLEEAEAARKRHWDMAAEYAEKITELRQSVDEHVGIAIKAAMLSHKTNSTSTIDEFIAVVLAQLKEQGK